MRTLTIDFETYYDSEYSLRKMTTQEYIQSPLFEIIGVSVGVNAEPPQWFSSSGILGYKAWLGQFNFARKDTVTIAHNAMFDGAVLEWILDIKPSMYFCSMMGSRPTVAPHTGKMSLDSVATWFGDVGVKGHEVFGALGKHTSDFTDEEMSKYAGYCTNDVSLSYRIANKLIPNLPGEELKLIDLTIKKFTRPKLIVDHTLVDKALVELNETNAKILAAAGLTSTEKLMSNPKFAALLEEHGVEVPMKISPTTGQPAYAFAKDDPGFVSLAETGSPVVKRLVAARVAHKSTIEKTRLETFKRVTRYAPDGKLGCPILYYGAHPGRFSGMDSLNLQNLGRGSSLRSALVAPPGHKVITGDLSQIEARILACLALQIDLVDDFTNKVDVYCKFASKLYDRVITKADTVERFVGKQSILSLGYQAGAVKFCSQMHKFGIEMEQHEADKIVATYRGTYSQIKGLWRKMEGMKAALLQGSYYEIGPVSAEPLTKRILLPNGMYLTYPQLYTDAEGRARYQFGNEWRDLYGGKLTENCVQALARIVMTTAELKMAKHGVNAALSVHDELVYVVPDAYVERVVTALQKCLTAKVPWMPELPVDCEIGIGQSYGDAK